MRYGLFVRAVGLEAEDNFEAVLYHWGARKVHCPKGEDPGVPLAYERATGCEDRNGVDFWIWLSCLGYWVPLDITVANGEDRSGYLAEKRRKALKRGVVVLKLRRKSLKLAAKGGTRYLNFIRVDLRAALKEQLPAIRDRLLTRQKIPRGG